MTARAAVLCLLSALWPCVALAGKDALEPIRTVEIGPNGEFRVNGKPFLPIMSWLQDTRRCRLSPPAKAATAR